MEKDIVGGQMYEFRGRPARAVMVTFLLVTSTACGSRSLSDSSGSRPTSTGEASAAATECRDLKQKMQGANATEIVELKFDFEVAHASNNGEDAVAEQCPKAYARLKRAKAPEAAKSLGSAGGLNRSDDGNASPYEAPAGDVDGDGLEDLPPPTNECEALNDIINEGYDSGAMSEAEHDSELEQVGDCFAELSQHD